MSTKNTYRLIAGVYVNEEKRRFANHCIVVTDKRLTDLCKGQFILLTSTEAPEEMPADKSKVTAKKLYDCTSKFALARDKSLTVARKGKLYFVAPLLDPKCIALNKIDLLSSKDVNDFITNKFN